MKALLLLIGLAAAPASAQVQIANVQAVKFVIPYETDCSSKTIGATAVNVVHNSTNPATTYAAFAAKVTNLSTAETVYCSDNASVTTSGNNIGEAILFSATTVERYWKSWGINPLQPWWCISTGANTSIMVCRSK